VDNLLYAVVDSAGGDLLIVDGLSER